MAKRTESASEQFQKLISFSSNMEKEFDSMQSDIEKYKNLVKKKKYLAKHGGGMKRNSRDSGSQDPLSTNKFVKTNRPRVQFQIDD